MPSTKLKLAEHKINSFFDLAGKHVFSRKDLNTILSQHRTDWRLARSTTTNNFIHYLLQSTKLREAELVSKIYSLPSRYTWGDASPYLVALSLRKAGYLSHGTALFLHGLIEQDSKNIYVNFEQSAKPRTGQLSQESIHRAFANRQRQSTYVFRHKTWQIAVISGKQTMRLGVMSIQTPEGNTMDVTNIERTLIDGAVRPDYAGGVYQVLRAYRSAKQKMSVNALLVILKQLDYIYPYHQAIGFYMQKGGYEESEFMKLKQFDLKYDFYLAHHMQDNIYNPEWRLFHPKGFE